MIIKNADTRTKDLEELHALANRADCLRQTQQKIHQEISALSIGINGEKSAAYYIDFYLGQLQNWMVLHDLRLECEGRVAQIDHLLMDRTLKIYVCESKSFKHGIQINEQGEFYAWSGNKLYGIPSPLEQNKRHISVLKSVFQTGQVKPPQRLGFTLMPSFQNIILVSNNARILRPKTQIEGLNDVIKADQLKTHLEQISKQDDNLLDLAKIISQETLELFARRLAEAHKPISINWAAKFGMTDVFNPISAHKDESIPEDAETVTVPKTTTEKKSRLFCFSCRTTVSYKVAKFCWDHKPRFGGRVFCIDCQKTQGAS